MALTIRKLGNKNFWHYFTIGGTDFEYSTSDIVITFDGNYAKLRATNGEIIGEREGYIYSSVTLYDDTGAGTPLTYASVILLEQALIDLGYIAFYEDGDVLLSLNELTDVDISSLSNGQALIYNSTSGQWENQTLAGGGDMLKATYDPNNVSDDAFDTDNFTAPTVAKTTPVDADLLTLWDSAASFISKKLTWANLKSTLKTYFDTLYASKTETLGLAFSDEDTAFTVDTDVLSFQMPNFATTLTGVSVNVKTAPLGSVATFDLNEGGTSVLSTKITIDAGETTSETAATPPVISDSSIAANAIMTVDIDGVGSTYAGNGGKIWIYYTRT